MILNNGHSWTLTKTSKDWLKSDVNGELAPRHVNLLIQKTTVDDDEANIWEELEDFSHNDSVRHPLLHMMLSAYNGRRRRASYFRVGRPAVRCPITYIRRDAISLHSVERFQWNLASIVIMWVSLLKSFFFKMMGVRGKFITQRRPWKYCALSCSWTAERIWTRTYTNTRVVP